MTNTPYFGLRLSLLDEAYPFYTPEDMEAALSNLKKQANETEERLSRVKAAEAELRALAFADRTEADACLRILNELSRRREEAEGLLATLRERSALLKEEWEDACFALCRAES